MRKAYKFRLYPSRLQAEALSRELAAAQRLYNAALEQRRFAWRRRGVSLGYNAQAGDLRDLRASGAQTPANYSCCQDVLRRLDKAFQAFFRRTRAGDKPGFPRFKSRDRYDSVTFPAYGDGCRIRENGKLYLQGVGEIRVKWHRQVAGKVKTVTVRRRAGRWHVCFSVECESEPLPVVETEVGIDMGLEHFAALSTGDLIANPRWYKSAQRRLRRAQRKVARRVRGSNGRRKAVRELQRVHEHVANQRSDFVHKLSRRVVDGYQLIAVEKLNVAGMSRGMLARQVHDAGWRSFLEKLTAKAAEAGRRVVEVKPAGTSQHCLCGCEVRKTLAVRVHRCPACGLVCPRDVVSAQLILRLGRSLASANVA
ncbi:MAG: transposase [Candidatus Tectomicrobia bacterium]|nr:transposase [Candidatus Tectomicrobia bacterium]